MEVKKILWPTDFSHSCNEVLPHVASLARKYEAQVEVMYVALDLGDIKTWYGDPGDHVERFNAWEIEKAEHKLDEVCGMEELNIGQAIHKKVVTGDPLEEIIKAIKNDHIDLVVMASRGRGADRRGVSQFGSLADKVMKNSPVPVLVVNPSELKDSPPA